MGLDLANYEHKAQDAKIDQGERSGVTAGENIDGFVALIADLVLKTFVSSFAGHIAAEASR